MAVDGLMADLLSGSGATDSGPIPSVVVRPPEAGERQPGSLLPLPATDANGNTVFLWSSLVIDWREHRIVIPDVWEPGWFSLDLARALQDLGSGGPVSFGYLDGAVDSSPLPVSLLFGRWNPEEWHPETSSPGSFDILMIRDGPGLEALAPQLPIILDAFMANGGGILVAPSTNDGELTAVSEWAIDRSLIKSPAVGSRQVLFIDRPEIFGPEFYRDLDTALLLAAGRIDLLAMMAGDVDGVSVRGRGAAGSRILKSGSDTGGTRIPDIDLTTEIIFSIDTAESLFSLGKKGGKWFLFSEDWQLPARSDRIESLLKRLESGSKETWVVTDNSALMNHEISDGLNIEFKTDRGKSLLLNSAGERRSGGGAWYRTKGGISLWPLLNAEDISGDARYWMERRLYPGTHSAIRVELRTDSRLFWRLHEEGEVHIFTDGEGNRTTLESRSASDYMGRLLRAEALTITPVAGGDVSPLVLALEDQSGRRIEYSLGDTGDGRVSAASISGINYILDDTLVDLILSGPAGS